MYSDPGIRGPLTQNVFPFLRIGSQRAACLGSSQGSDADTQMGHRCHTLIGARQPLRTSRRADNRGRKHVEIVNQGLSGADALFDAVTDIGVDVAPVLE